MLESEPFVFWPMHEAVGDIRAEGMSVEDKLRALEEFYLLSFSEPEPVVAVPTSGSYARRVRELARHGSRSPEEVERIALLAEHLRAAFKIVDDLIDEDTTRDNQPAFWVSHGREATIRQAAWHVHQARTIAQRLGPDAARIFELRLQEVIDGARLEVELEMGWEPPDLQAAWHRVVKKEASFRQMLAELLRCPPWICEAARQDGVAAQILDDGRSAIWGKEGRPPGGSDERLGRLTYMRAFGVSPEEAIRRGEALKARAREILGRGGWK